MTALDLLRDSGEVDGRDLRRAGITSTSTGGAALLLDLEREGPVVRTGRGWKLAPGRPLPSPASTPASSVAGTGRSAGGA